MTTRTYGGLLVLGGLLSGLVLVAAGFGPVAAEASGSPASVVHAGSATEPSVDTTNEPVVEPGDELAINDPALQASASVELSGEIVVSISERPPVTDAETPAIEFAYSVETTNGMLVPIAGDIPESVSTGDSFTGSVAVATEVVETLTPEAAVEVEASIGADAVAEETPTAQQVHTSAAATGADMTIVEAQVTVASAATVAGAQTHELVFVINTPAGQAPVTHTDAQLRAMGTTVADHWRTSSNGHISQFTVNPTIARTSGGTCAEDPFVTWDRAASQLGYGSWRDFRIQTAAGSTRHLVVINPRGCSESGVGIVGSNLHYGGAVRQSIGSGVDTSTLAHEIGHNFSLGHSNLHSCAGTACTHHEYWDIYDVMGLGVVGYDALTPLNTSTASRLGFLPTAGTSHHALPAGTSTKTWTVVLSKLEAASGIRHLSLTDPVTAEVFHVEMRSGEGTPTSYYAQSPTRVVGGRTVSFSPGVRMLRASGNGSVAIAPIQTNGSYRPAIVAGQSMQSPSGGITVKAVSGTVTSSMTLSVTLGAVAPAASEAQPVYRFWSDTYQGHFYTVSAAEKNQILATYPSHIWRYEAVAYNAFTTQQPGTVPLHRFWSATMNGHFFTASASEKQQVIDSYDDSVWKYEGVAYFVYPASSKATATTPVFRFWSDTKRHHFYTASESEKNHVIATYAPSVWQYEMAAYRVPKA